MRLTNLPSGRGPVDARAADHYQYRAGGDLSRTEILMRRIPFLAAVAVLAFAADVQAQDTASTAARPVPQSLESRKSVTTARLLAILPSAGHIYAGETGRGLAFLGGMAGVLAIGTLAIVGDCIASYSSAECEENSSRDTAIAVAFYGLWGWSIYDAGSAARRTNARRGFASSTILVEPLAHRSIEGMTSRGLKLGARFALPR